MLHHLEERAAAIYAAGQAKREADADRFVENCPAGRVREWRRQSFLVALNQIDRTLAAKDARQEHLAHRHAVHAAFRVSPLERLRSLGGVL